MAKNAKGIVRRVSVSAPVGVLFFLLACSLTTQAEPERPENFAKGDFDAAFRYLGDFIENKMDEESVVGLSLAVFDKDKVIYSRGFGFADKDAEIPASSVTLYRIGAITTLFTTVAIMQLVAENKLSLSDPVSRYVPGFQMRSHEWNKGEIRISHLLSHHSGLPIAYLKGMWSNNPDSTAQLLEKLQSEYTNFPPNKIFSFSNLGYVLLGAVIEKIEGKPYETVIQEKILKPLGMSSTMFDVATDYAKQLSRGYKDGDEKPLLKARDVAAMGLYSNTTDMVRFGQLFLGGDSGVLNTTLLQQTMQPQNKTVEMDLGRETGLGWQLGDNRFWGAKKVAYRYGSTMMFRSRITLLPEENLGVVILANSSRSFRAIEDITEEVINAILEVQFTRNAPPADSEVNPPALDFPSKFAAHYSSVIGYVKIQPENDDYLADLGGWTFHLKQDKADWYSARYDLLGFIPLKLDWIAKVRMAPAWVEGQNVVVSFYNGQPHLFATALNSVKTSKAWKQRVGEYVIANPDAQVEHYDVHSGELKLDGEQLVFSYKLPMFIPVYVNVPIKIVSDDLAIVPGYGSGLGDTIRVAKYQGREALMFSGYALTKTAE